MFLIVFFFEPLNLLILAIFLLYSIYHQGRSPCALRPEDNRRSSAQIPIPHTQNRLSRRAVKTRKQPSDNMKTATDQGQHQPGHQPQPHQHQQQQAHHHEALAANTTNAPPNYM